MPAVIRLQAMSASSWYMQLRRVGAALADEAGVEPLLRDALELAEQVELRLLAGVAPLRVEQPLRQVEQQRRRPHVLEVLEGQVAVLADDALRCA